MAPKRHCLSVRAVPGQQPNLGLGNSATRDIGTSTGTVAAGDDSRITGAAQKSSNLSDLTNASTARSNLGLGNVDNTSDATKNSASATLSNKTINLANNTLSGTTTQFNSALSDGDIATLAGSETLTNKTINAASNTISNLATSHFAGSTIVTEAEGIASSDNDTSLPTSAAVKDYVDNNGGAVASVFGRTGVVTAPASDYGADQIDVTPAGTIAATNVQAALEELDADIQDTVDIETLPDAAALDGTEAVVMLQGGSPVVEDIDTIGIHIISSLDSDLTAIAGLSPTNDDIIQRKAGAWTNRTMAQLKTDLTLTSSDVGLGNVDNTSDATKNSASATLSNKTIDVDNNTLSNIEVDNFKASAIVTEAEGIGSNDNDTTLPTSAAVKDYVDGSGGGSSWGSITGTLSDQSDLQAELDGKADTSHTHTSSEITDFASSVGSATATLTNKTFDANGTGNSLSNVEVADLAASAVVTEAEGIGGNDNDTTLPTSAAVKDYVDGVTGGSGVWGSITGTLSDQSDLQTALDAKQASDSDLTAIAGLSPTNDDIIQRKAGDWTAFGSAKLTASFGIQAFYKQAVGDETGTVTFTRSGVANNGGVMITVSGHNPMLSNMQTFIDGSNASTVNMSNISATKTTTTNTSITSPTLPISGINRLYIWCGGMAANETITDPTGYTNIASLGTSGAAVNFSLCYKIITTPITEPHQTSNGARQNNGTSVALGIRLLPDPR